MMDDLDSLAGITKSGMGCNRHVTALSSEQLEHWEGFNLPWISWCREQALKSPDRTRGDNGTLAHRRMRAPNTGGNSAPKNYYCAIRHEGLLLLYMISTSTNYFQN